jgi:hypothetical protein
MTLCSVRDGVIMTGILSLRSQRSWSGRSAWKARNSVPDIWDACATVARGMAPRLLRQAQDITPGLRFPHEGGGGRPAQVSSSLSQYR